MRLKTITLGGAAALAALSPVVAQAADAARASAPVGDENELGYPDSGVQLLVLALVVAAIVVGIEVTGDDEPSSP